MKNVYIVKFENTVAFSTARKAVEYAQEHFGDWNYSYDWMKDSDGKPLKEFSTEKLINIINTELRTIIAYDGTDCVDVFKCFVN